MSYYRRYHPPASSPPAQPPVQQTGGRYSDWVRSQANPVSPPSPPPPRRQSAKPHPAKYWVVGSSVLALAAFVIVPPRHRAGFSEAVADVCQQVVQTNAVLSREQLSQLLSVDLQANRDTVRQVIDQPYCVLNSGETPTGLPVEREAYPLAFDPQTWVVVQYEADSYVGYDFTFRRP